MIKFIVLAIIALVGLDKACLLTGVYRENSIVKNYTNSSINIYSCPDLTRFEVEPGSSITLPFDITNFKAARAENDSFTKCGFDEELTDEDFESDPDRED